MRIQRLSTSGQGGVTSRTRRRPSALAIGCDAIEPGPSQSCQSAPGCRGEACFAHCYYGQLIWEINPHADGGFAEHKIGARVAQGGVLPERV